MKPLRILACLAAVSAVAGATDAQARPHHGPTSDTRTVIHQGQQDRQVFARRLDAEMPGLLDAFAVPGTAVALIQNGKVVWMRGYGLANTTTARAITPDTVFNVGSLSKTGTAWGVMRLVEAGIVDLDQPVDTYLKRWHLPPSQFDNSQVTVRRVLSHTSGISNHDFHGWDPATPLPPIEDTLSGRTGTGEVRVVAAPGSGFAYSGANYAILQLLIEDVSGQSFQDYMTANVLAPLGMSDSRYGLPDHAEAVMATPYDGLRSALPVLRYNELSAAGLTTTLHDLANLAAAGLKGEDAMPGRGVLQPATIVAMQTAAPASRWADRDPYGPDPQYGFGYTVRPLQFRGHTGVGHGGSNNGWESIIEVVPDTGDGIVIMTNSSNGSAVISSVLCTWRQWGAGTAKGVECPTIDIRVALVGTYQAKGAQAAVDLYRQLRRNAPDKYDFSVRQLNSLGYQLLRKPDIAGAVAIFSLNAEQFPTDGNVFDSLGEAYLAQGDKPRAIASYQKSLALNPYNDNARNVLKTLVEPEPGTAKPWPSQPPAGMPFALSRELTGIVFTGRHAQYTTADTWYPSWAADGKMYSPWTDGMVNGVGSGSYKGAEATTGHATIVGDDPMNLQITDAGTIAGSATPCGGRYPAGSLYYKEVWYYGTYCLNQTADKKLNWDVLGPFVGFDISLDQGKSWRHTARTPEQPLFPEHIGDKIRIGAPHFVDFGQDMQNSPDGKAYLVAHGSSAATPLDRDANLSWITGDEVYLLRVTPSPEAINDPSQYEFFAGHDAQGKAVWTHDFARIQPVVQWDNNMGSATMTYDAPLKAYLMAVTDGTNTVGKFNTYILESRDITGPWKLVSYLKDFGQQAYFVNFPSKFISSDGRTLWMSYSANFSNIFMGTNFATDPAGGGYWWTLQEVRLLEPNAR